MAIAKKSIVVVMAKLSDQQVKIMERICAGKKSAEIASELGISENTVHAHLQRSRLKLGASSMHQAAVLFDRLTRALA